MLFSGFLFTPALTAQTAADANAALRRLEASLASGSGVTSAQVTQGGVQPNWVNDPYAVYNRDRYFAAIGYGPNRVQAEAQALSALAAIFGQIIEWDFSAATVYTEAVNKGAVTVTENTNIRDVITRAASLNNLAGAETGYVWDSGRGTVYSAAYLDKARAVSLYTDMIIINCRDISLLTAMTNEEKNTFDGVSRYRIASQIAAINQNYAAVVTQSGGSVASLNLNNASFYRLEAANIMRGLVVAVTVDGDRANRLQNAFANVLTSENLRTRGNYPPYTLEVVVFTQEVFFPDNRYKWCVMEVRGNLIENSTGASLFPVSMELREGHTTYAQAESRAYLIMESEIAQRFPPILRGYLASVMP